MSSEKKVTKEQYATAMLGFKNAAGRSVGSEVDTLAWYVETYLEELTQERDELRRKLWDWNGQFETQEARLEAVTAERDRLMKQVEELTDTCSKEAHEQER